MSDDTRYPTIPLRENPTGQGVMLVCMAMLALGAVMVFSASVSVVGGRAWHMRDEFRHLLYAGLGAIMMLLLWRLDYRVLNKGEGWPVPAGIVLIVSLILAAIVLIPGIGSEVNGARRWLRLSFPGYTLSFQPSEMVKLALLIFMACWLGRPSCDPRSLVRTYLPAMGLIGICVGLVIIEDFGTAALIGVSAVAMLLLAGVPWFYVLGVLPPAVAGFYVFVVMEPVRWMRIMAFMDPWNEAFRQTYQPRQALIAIGSGGLWGKGLGSGTLKLGFLPEDNTDYIFSVICEELGFAGAATVLALVATLMYLSWRSGGKASDRTGRLLASGLGLLIVLQALGHIAVNIGSVPPKGMSLPLISAGGTGLVLIGAAIGLIISVTAHRRC